MPKRSAANWRAGLRGVPDRAICIDLLIEICEEAFWTPGCTSAPELTARYWAVHHWLHERTPLPSGFIAEHLAEPSTARAIACQGSEVLAEIMHG